MLHVFLPGSDASLEWDRKNVLRDGLSGGRGMLFSVDPTHRGVRSIIVVVVESAHCSIACGFIANRLRRAALFVLAHCPTSRDGILDLDGATPGSIGCGVVATRRRRIAFVVTSGSRGFKLSGGRKRPSTSLVKGALHVDVDPVALGLGSGRPVARHETSEVLSEFHDAHAADRLLPGQEALLGRPVCLLEVPEGLLHTKCDLGWRPLHGTADEDVLLRSYAPVCFEEVVVLLFIVIVDGRSGKDRHRHGRWRCEERVAGTIISRRFHRTGPRRNHNRVHRLCSYGSRRHEWLLFGARHRHCTRPRRSHTQFHRLCGCGGRRLCLTRKYHGRSSRMRQGGGKLRVGPLESGCVRRSRRLRSRLLGTICPSSRRVRSEGIRGRLLRGRMHWNIAIGLRLDGLRNRGRINSNRVRNRCLRNRRPKAKSERTESRLL